jgi:hypothetical protein
MRRSLLVYSLSMAAILAAAGPTAATGPGGWNHVGTSPTAFDGSPLNGNVYVINHDVPNVLYVGGVFKDAGGVAAADAIARWDGVHWSALGTTSMGNGGVNDIVVHAGKVYAGGSFVNAGGNPAADYLAVFDGTTWKPFCNQTAQPAFSFNVNALELIGTKLYVGGAFQNTNGDARADYLVVCDINTGAMSLTVDHDGDFTGAVYDLAATTDGRLYAGGTFSNLDGQSTADNVASYMAGSWQGLSSTPIGGIVRDLHANGMTVWVATDGLDIGGDPKADHLVRWNGTSYSAVGSNRAGNNGYFPTSAYINEIITDATGTDLFVAGTWQNADGQATHDSIAHFKGAWDTIGSNGAGQGAFNGENFGLAIFQDQLYVGGASSHVGGDVQANYIASRGLRLGDARLGTTLNGPVVGNNVYNTTTVGQTRTVTARRSTTRDMFIDVQNDGTLSGAFKLLGTGTASGYTVHYFKGATDVTTQVKNGTFITTVLAPGDRFSLKIAITLSATAVSEGRFTITTWSSTPGSATPKDAVKAIVMATN